MQGVRSNYFGILWKRGDVVYNFEISDQYERSLVGFDGDYEYYGYVTTTGVFIIQQFRISTGQWRYATGQSGYSSLLPFASNLTALGALTYGTYDSIFS